MRMDEFSERVAEYLRSIDDEKTASRVKELLIKCMADNNPFENVSTDK